MKKKTTTLDRLEKFKNNGMTSEDEGIPEGVFVGIVRRGREYQVLELYVTEKGKEVQEHEPSSFGYALAKAEDRLAELAWQLNNTPWTKAQKEWKKLPGVL